jgi:hypothetical protein
MYTAESFSTHAGALRLAAKQRSQCKRCEDVAPNTPGALGVIYDGAFRGMHHTEIMHDLGWLSINRVQSAELIKRDGKVVKRVDKMTHIEDKQINGKTVRLFARKGAIGIVDFDHNGNQEFVELKRRRTLRREDKNGKFRWYNEYTLPDGNRVIVRLDTTDIDRQRKLNRAENVRQIAQTDPDFKGLYGRRADAESINRQLDDSLWLGRAHSKGALRQSVNLLGYALMVNGLALHLDRKRRNERPEANLPPDEVAA